MNLATVRSTLATALEDAGIDYSTSAYPPPVVIPPSVVIVPGSPWLQPQTIGRPGTPRVLVTFRLTCCVAHIDPQASLNQLEDLMFAVIDNLPRGWDVSDAGPPSLEQVGPSELLVADLQVSTLASPS